MFRSGHLKFRPVENRLCSGDKVIYFGNTALWYKETMSHLAIAHVVFREEISVSGKFGTSRKHILRFGYKLLFFYVIELYYYINPQW